jgi:Domain of unknown function (DUF5666)
VSGTTIHARTGDRPITIYADDHVEFWKGKTFHGLSQLRAGDQITCSVHKDPSGKLAAIHIDDNIVNFSGVITRVDGNRFELFTNPNADPASAYKKETKTVEYDADTIFDCSKTPNVEAGHDAQVVGLDLRNGTVRATRMWRWENNQPVCN